MSEQPIQVSYFETEKGQITLVVELPDGSRSYQAIDNEALVALAKKSAPSVPGKVTPLRLPCLAPREGAPAKRVVGYQVADEDLYFFGGHTSYDILTLEHAEFDLEKARREQPDRHWTLSTIYEGDIEDPRYIDF